MIYVFLAEGFEEVEAVATIDVLRRAGINTVTVGVGNTSITGAHNITVNTDISDSEIKFIDLEAVVLPGGMPGTTNLEECSNVIKTIKYCKDNNLLICAICAAPSILGHLGMLSNVDATCYPGYENDLHGALLSDKYVIKSGNFITAKGPGVTIEFALKIVSTLTGDKKSETIRRNMQCP